MRTILRVTTLVFVAACLFLPSGAAALNVIQPGVRTGIYEDGDNWFLGVDVKTKVAMIAVNPNFEWIFVDNANSFTLNVDGLLTVFPIPLLDPYVGAGIGTFYVKPDNRDSKNDFAFNLIGGVSFNVKLNPYVQIKYVITDNNTWVIAGGIHF